MAETKAPNTSAEQLITEHLDIWTTAIEQKSPSGRGSSKKFSLHGIKKLRELILELAVRGKLVPQDPNDEPASVLLERIAAEKAQLVKDKKIKKPKALPVISEDEKPFDIPKGWEWTRLGNIASTSTGYAFKSSQYIEKGVFVLRVTNINSDGSINKQDNKFIDRTSAEKEFDRFLLAENDLLLVMVGGSLGKIGVVSKDILPAVLNQNMWKINRFGNISVTYFQFLLKYINENQITITASTHGHLAQGDYLNKIAPLPPLEEQHRIVAKVDELMRLCDALEAQTENSISAHQTLVEVLLAALLKAPEQTATPEQATAQFQQNWQRLSEHFDTLFTTTASIDTLKQTILQLAVMGKLVPQNPNDEPAAKLLERIAAEKAQLIKDKKIKKQKPLPEIIDEEKPFELPDGWRGCRLGEVLQVISDYHANGGYKILKENVELLDEPDYAIMLRTTNFSEKNYNNYKYITEQAYNFLDKSKLYSGDIIMNKIGDPGASFYVDDRGQPMSLAMNLFLLRTQSVSSRFVFLYLSGNYDYIRGFANGTSTQTITKEAVASLVFSLPPLEEQHRIVTKVNELMTLCDQLKARLIDAQTTKLHLTDAIVEQAL